MAVLLESAHLVDEHRMAEVKVGRGRIETRLDAQRLTACKLAYELGLDQQLSATATDLPELLGDHLVHPSVHRCIHPHAGYS